MTDELKIKAAKKTYKTLCKGKMKVSLTLLIDQTYKTWNDKYVVSIPLDKVKEHKNYFYNFFNVRVSYENKTVSFVYSEQELVDTQDNENTDKKLNSIMDKIQKLLNVTEERGATEAEAITASLLAQKLMKKYNVEYADVSQTEDEPIVNLEADTPSGNKWKYGFAVTVANNYCCNVFREGNKLFFRGYKNDTLIARRVYMYLLDTCIKLGKKERAKGKDFTSFCLGFINGVRIKLEENCKALALIIPPKVQSEWEEYKKDFKDGIEYSFNQIDAETFKNGVREGKKAVDGQYLDGTRSNNNSETKLLTTH